MKFILMNMELKEKLGRRQGTNGLKLKTKYRIITSLEKDKIVWPETSMDNQFCLVEKDVYLDKTSFFIASDNKFLCGLLNSNITRFYLDTLVSKMRGGYFSMSKIYVEQLPIPKISKEVQKPFEELVDQISAAKQADPAADTTVLEKEIDQLVYKLYDLTEEEIQLVEATSL